MGGSRLTLLTKILQVPSGSKRYDWSYLHAFALFLRPTNSVRWLIPLGRTLIWTYQKCELISFEESTKPGIYTMLKVDGIGELVFNRCEKYFFIDGAHICWSTRDNAFFFLGLLFFNCVCFDFWKWGTCFLEWSHFWFIVFFVEQYFFECIYVRLCSVNAYLMVHVGGSAWLLWA